jgi:NADPH-dependent 2,4-dienoyl-CoA reductase/sulfur reductase-like enzyme
VIGEPLAKIQDDYPDIAIGSYPKYDSGKFWTEIVLRGAEEKRLGEAEAAVAAMVSSLPA